MFLVCCLLFIVDHSFLQILVLYKGRFYSAFLCFFMFFWLDPKEPKSQGCRKKAKIYLSRYKCFFKGLDESQAISLRYTEEAYYVTSNFF